MASSYEFWLCDDNGRRLTLLKNVAYFSYTRTTRGFGTILLGLPLKEIMAELGNTFFRVDWRIDVWRSPSESYPLRRECSFLLRKEVIYQRIDGIVILEYFGRSAIDLLRRDNIRPSAIFSGAPLDDIMLNLAYILGLASGVESSSGPFATLSPAATYPDYSVNIVSMPDKGPTIDYDPQSKNMLDCIQELQAISFQLNQVSSANNKIYFDVIEMSIPGRPAADFGYKFVTFAGLRGIDRTNRQVFSIENGNISQPHYVEDHLDESNYVFLISSDGTSYFTTPTSDAELSRWNRISLTRTTSIASANTAALNSEQKRIEAENSAKKTFSCVFTNSPGSNVQPRSLYGIDWDLGDLLPVSFVGKSITAEVAIVYVNMDENGKEEVTGRTEVGSA